MPVDENIISEKIKGLDDAINTSDRKTSVLRKLRYRLDHIQLRENIDPNDSTKKIKSLPIDEGINKTMTAPRRQALYDSIIAEVESELV